MAVSAVVLTTLPLIELTASPVGRAQPPPPQCPPGQAPPLPGQSVLAPPGATPVAPSAFDGDASGGPSITSATYDPQTGQYLTADGALHQINTVAAGSAPKSWKDLLPV
ncbi:hypothetical protein [Mycobacterium sp. NAZ190054]|uniref:hypothetical protein n=1 Tax=Mycobacterium sp. NAZ190054 TaxID=1747766 RepID=UPI001E3737EA|nr:hypothetical protein [Mycobacterium sp. NAZ190054]